MWQTVDAETVKKERQLSARVSTLDLQAVLMVSDSTDVT